LLNYGNLDEIPNLLDKDSNPEFSNMLYPKIIQPPQTGEPKDIGTYRKIDAS